MRPVDSLLTSTDNIHIHYNRILQSLSRQPFPMCMCRYVIFFSSNTHVLHTLVRNSFKKRTVRRLVGYYFVSVRNGFVKSLRVDVAVARLDDVGPEYCHRKYTRLHIYTPLSTLSIYLYNVHIGTTR